MDQIQYIGERIWPGNLGHFLIVLSFVASLFAAATFIMAQKRRDGEEFNSWKRMGNIGFAIHGVSILSAIGLLFFIMINQYYEYQYVNGHVSDDLQMRYIFSAFWEGQEGSFMLWMFWHVILGGVILWRADQWQAPVLAVISIIQLFLLSMILGVHIPFGEETIKIGSSPFLLLREVFDLPLFSKANYVELLQGQGLNIALQNYWMTIHPPTLFLGFAATSVPFAYAIAGLWSGTHKESMKAILPWALFTGGILGTGILMGAAWAYEALSFGGYWAWDPVENTSLVPWLILIAALHSNLIAKATGYSIKSTYLFYILTFIFVLYSTYLTRSGILGDSSAHAFTEMGLEAQLIFFIAFFLIGGLWLYFKNSKSIVVPEKEEATFSKEFWMFIGSLILIFSAVLITFTTSIPVYNVIGEIFGLEMNLSSPDDVVAHHNKYQIWIGVLIGILSGFAQFLRWKEFDFARRFSSLGKQIALTLAITIVCTVLTIRLLDYPSAPNILLVFAGYYAIFSNLDYIIFMIRGKMKIAGSAFSHIGFGLFVLGVIASGVNKSYLSSNPYAQRGLFEEFDYEKNVTLIKGLPMYMNDYKVTYLRDTFDGFHRYYHINFKELGDSSGTVQDEFDSYPSIIYDKNFKFASVNPSTKRYAQKDIFNHLAGAPEAELDPERAREIEDSLSYVFQEMAINRPITLTDTVKVDDARFPRFHQIQLLNVRRTGEHPEYLSQEGDLVFSADLEIQKYEADSTIRKQAMIVLRENLLFNFPAQINTMGWKAKLTEEFINRYFEIESNLSYRPFTLKEGQTARFSDYTIELAGFDRQPENPGYSALPNDIAIAAVLNIKDSEDNLICQLRPIYLVRNSQVYIIKDESFQHGFSAKFANVDPQAETFTVSLAEYDLEQLSFPVAIAQDSPRNDWIVLESIVFPGINLVWVGSILMMFGLFFSIWNRISRH
ncbi:MAG: cytochrome c biogenesis protein CcsA [Bacteroidia bacterium]|nr:cytochrome c biogenesis protein CcsA [Bacteroidia bacterium]